MTHPWRLRSAPSCVRAHLAHPNDDRTLPISLFELEVPRLAAKFPVAPPGDLTAFYYPVCISIAISLFQTLHHWSPGLPTATVQSVNCRDEF